MKISIITINYNDVNGLEATFKSVFNQTYKDIEYIVIDGGSCDGSIALIEQNASKITHWLSEPDDGIYPAMNKGVDFATGDYLIFLNSGDSFYQNTVLQCFCNEKPKEDIVYGKTLIDNGHKRKIKDVRGVVDLASSLSRTINHQSIFHSKRLFENGNRYSLKYSIISDWVFINDLVKKQDISFKFIDIIVAIFETNGISSNWERIAEERKEYMEHNFSPDAIRILESYKYQVSLNNSLRNHFAIKSLLNVKKLIKKGTRYFE